MFKNKRTRVLMYITGGLFVAVIGVGAWGVGTGKIKSSADVFRFTPQIGTIKGTIKSTEGTPIGAASIALLLMDTSTPQRSATTTTDASGNYAFNLTPSNHKYQISVIQDRSNCHDLKSSDTFYLYTNATVTQNLNLQEWPWIKGKVTTSAGNPVNGANVFLSKLNQNGVDTSVWRTTTDSGGYYKFSCQIATGSNGYPKYSIFINYWVGTTLYSNLTNEAFRNLDYFTLGLPGKIFDTKLIGY